MSTQQITSAQISGGVGSGSLEQFSGSPGNVTSFTITTVGTVRDGNIAFANTTDSLYLSCSFTFGNLSTGTARDVFAYLYNNGGGTGRIVKVSRSSAGNVLTVSWSDETDRALLTTVTGLVSLGSLISFNSRKYVATVRTA